MKHQADQSILKEWKDDLFSELSASGSAYRLLVPKSFELINGN